MAIPSVPLSNIPVPDPSEITSREIAKAKIELRDEFSHQLVAIKEISAQARALVREILETRLNAMDTANIVLSENVNRVPTLMDRESLRLEKLFEEKLQGLFIKFDGIQLQFRERDIRTDQDKIAASTAVNAALQAQKEAAGAQNEANAAAITKSENSFTKEIDGLKTLINATKDAITSDVSNLTGRLDRGEGATRGGKEAVTDGRASMASVLGIVGGVVGVLGFFVMVILSLSGHAQQQSSSPPSAIAVAPISPSAIQGSHQ